VIKVPADKLAAAVDKWLKPGVLRHVAKQSKLDREEKKSS
jgi:hypothetical protein